MQLHNTKNVDAQFATSSDEFFAVYPQYTIR